MKIQISLSSIELSVAKPMIKGWDKNRYEDLFTRFTHSKNKYRIYLPLGDAHKHKRIVIPDAIQESLLEHGYIVDDYYAGIAVKKDNLKKKIKIGKLLQTQESKKLYDNDPQRASVKHTKLWVVISRHPYDLLGMSFNRGWTSCMNIEDGINKQFVKRH